MPAADAAVRLARALSCTVEELFCPAETPGADRAIAVLGDGLAEGALVRAAWVGGRLVARVVDRVSALASVGAAADGVITAGRVRLFDGAAAAGAVVAGCDPVLAIAEGLLERPGPERVVGVPATTGEALGALAAGRCHAALVHGPARALGSQGRPELRRWHIARWRSGVAVHPAWRRPSLEALLTSAVLVERASTAACQQAVERARRRLGLPRPAGPTGGQIPGGHLDAARTALERRGAAVTIEPVALAMGLGFLSLEVHDVELWAPATDSAVVAPLLDLLASARFRDRAGALPAYDLTDTGALR